MNVLWIVFLFCYVTLSSATFLATVTEMSTIVGPVEFFPIMGTVSPEMYYNYKDSSANLPIYDIEPTDKRINVFLYEFQGKTNLFVVFDKKDNGYGGKAEGTFTITYKNTTESIQQWHSVYSDDPQEKILSNTGSSVYSFKYSWTECCTDGFIFGGPTPSNSSDYCIKMDFKDVDKVTSVYVYSLADDGTLIPKLVHNLTTRKFLLEMCGNSNFINAKVTNKVKATCPKLNDGSISLSIQGNRPPFNVDLYKGQSSSSHYTYIVDTPNEFGIYELNITQLSGDNIMSVSITDNEGNVIEGQDITGNYFFLGSDSCSDVSFDWIGSSTQLRLSQLCGCNTIDRWLKIKFKSIEEISPRGSRVIQKVPTLSNSHNLELYEEEYETKFNASTKRVYIEGPVRIAGSKVENPIVSIYIWYFLESSIFPDNGYEIPKSAIKWDFDISNWPFKSNRNKLRLNIEIQTPRNGIESFSKDDDNDDLNDKKEDYDEKEDYDQCEDKDQNERDDKHERDDKYEKDKDQCKDLIIRDSKGISYEIMINENEFPARFYLPNFAFIDNSKDPSTIDVNINCKGSHTLISLDFPHFDHSINYDPISILPSKRCGNKVLDEGEQCDFGAYGCTKQCTCAKDLLPSGDISCIQKIQNQQELEHYEKELENDEPKEEEIIDIYPKDFSSNLIVVISLTFFFLILF